MSRAFNKMDIVRREAIKKLMRKTASLHQDQPKFQEQTLMN
jgi:hypothetical protein